MKKSFIRGAIAFLIETLIMLMISVVISFGELLPDVITNILNYAVYSLFGAVLSYFTRLNKVNNYLAWLPAPCVYPLGFYIVWGYLPSIGPSLAAALIAIIGSATAETRLRFERKKTGNG